MNEIELVENRGGKPVVSSRMVAENFHKDHNKVLRKINELISEKPILASQMIETEYSVAGNNKTYLEYLLTRDGFSLLVMGFTGKEALEWKLKYIDAFNKMEAALVERNKAALPATYKEALQHLLIQVEENERLLAENNELYPKAEYHDVAIDEWFEDEENCLYVTKMLEQYIKEKFSAVLNRPNLIPISVIAKDLGMASATELNRIMYQNKIIYKQGGVWKPYAEYEWLIRDGYADYQSYSTMNSDPLLKWTEKGRKWIVENLETWRAVDKTA